MQFSDIHIHALYNCDDGAKSPEDMYKMIDAAYLEGTRYICLTPHYNPGYFGENSSKSKEAFDLLWEYTKNKYHDLQIVLGNELRYNPGCEMWLAEGCCRSMNKSKYVLVDFLEEEREKEISKGIDKLLSAGYLPILAHAERYRHIRGDLTFLKKLRDDGVLIQIDAGSIFGEFGCVVRLCCKKILKNKIADFVSSDAHSPRKSPHGMKDVYEYIEKNCGKDYAEAICLENAVRIIFGR